MLEYVIKHYNVSKYTMKCYDILKLIHNFRLSGLEDGGFRCARLGHRL